METVKLTNELHDKVTDVLRSVPLFKTLKEHHLDKILEVAQILRFTTGDTIVQQGTVSDSFYLILEGDASVYSERSTGERAHLTHLGPASTVGEIGVILHKPRTATVVANEDMLVLKYSGEIFLNMFDQIAHFGLAITQGLADRLDRVSGQVPLAVLEPEEKPRNRRLVDLLPVSFMLRHRVLPVRQEKNVVTVGFLEDPSPAVLGAIYTHLPGMEVRPVRIHSQYFNEIMRSRAGVDDWSEKDAPPKAADDEKLTSPKLDSLLERMVAEGVSDLHLPAGHRPRWRLDGDLQELEDAPVLSKNEVRELLEPVMSDSNKSEFEEMQDADFCYSSSEGRRFRVNIFRDSRGVSAALRMIPSQIFTLDQLGLPAMLKELCNYPKGLVLVTGPAGSGKSTTLASMVDHINRTRPTHIITLEEPIEFVHESNKSLISQREVGGHTPNYARALRASLREDPDVVLVGELRDQETISLALETANTGHLVFATLHTNSAVTTVDRLINMFPPDQQSDIRMSLSETLRGVVAQALCKMRQGGRTAAVEVMVVTRPVANLIRENKSVQIPNIMQAAKKDGHTTLNDELIKLVESRKIEYSEALNKTLDREELSVRLNRPLSRVYDVT